MKNISESVNFNEVVNAIAVLNPNVEIRIGDIEYDPEALSRIYSSVDGSSLILPDGFEYNDKNGITNKHNTKSGAYISIRVETLKLEKEHKPLTM